MLRDSVVVVVVRTRPRAKPVAMITMRKSTHGFPFVSHIWVAYGAPLITMRKSLHGFPLLFYGYGAPLGGLRPPELCYYRKVVVVALLV